MSYVRRRPRRSRSRRFPSATSGSLGLRLWRAQTRHAGGEARFMSSAKLIGGLLFLLLGLLLYYLFVSYEFFVYDVQVVGMEHLGLQEVLDASQVEEMSVFYVRPAEVEARLQKLPWVKEARVRSGLPNRVRIVVRERQVAFMWRQGKNVWAVDGDGRLLPLGQAPEDVLWVEDHRRPSDRQVESQDEGLDQELIASVLRVREALPDVSLLSYGPAHGLTFQSQRGYEVRLGWGRMAHKVAIWRALDSELAARGIEPSYVDLRFPIRPCYGLLGALEVTAREPM